MSSSPAEPQAAYFPIRVVSNETGVNAITLRAWERRYGLITPKRTAKGHRLYTEADIHLIRKVVSLLERGIPISQAKSMLENGTPEAEPLASMPAQPSQWHQYRARLNQAVNEFDDAALASVMDEVTSFFPADITLRFLLLPLHQQLHEQMSTPLGGARFAFFAGFLEGRLTSRLAEAPEGQTKGTLVLANTTQEDSLELLLLGIMLRPLGVRILRLGGLVPPADISAMVNELTLQGAIIRITGHPNDQQLQQLQNLAAETGQLIFAIGHNQDQTDLLRRKGIVTLSGDLQQDALTVRDVLTGIQS